MKRLYSFAMLTFLLLAAGCSSAAQPDLSIQDAPPASETAGIAPQASADKNTISGESDWAPVLECSIPHQIFLAGFLNKDFGIILGINGEIRYTNDGGQTWQESENSSTDRYCLDIVDENTAWCGGNMGNVCMSGDGGKTWTLSGTAYMIIGHSNIDFIDGTTGWVASPSELAATGDGGQTWTKLPLPEGADGIASICLRTPENGYLLSRDGTLYSTADGGATWNNRDLGFKNYDIADINKQPRLNRSIPTSADISFTDETSGTIVFIGKSAFGTGYHTWCLTTEDGGATWKSERISLTDFSPSKVFLSGDGKYLTLSDINNDTVVLKRKV